MKWREDMQLDSKNISKVEINDFLGKEFSCGCGKKHFFMGFRSA